MKLYEKATEKLLDTHNDYDHIFILRFKEKDENLEAAFIHLSRITIESKFPGKPSFEETVEYINSYLSQIKNVPSVADAMNGYADIKAEVTQDNFDINNFELRVSFTHMEEKQKFTISLSDIVKIGPASRQDRGGSASYYYIQFYKKGEGKETDRNLPLMFAKAPGLEFVEDLEIYKAFNHLHKLCGAREPLKFD